MNEICVYIIKRKNVLKNHFVYIIAVCNRRDRSFSELNILVFVETKTQIDQEYSIGSSAYGIQHTCSAAAVKSSPFRRGHGRAKVNGTGLRGGDAFYTHTG